jgi:hypothetical protein
MALQWMQTIDGGALPLGVGIADLMIADFGADLS